MKSYTIEFNGTGEVCEGSFRFPGDAMAWVESVLMIRGYSSPVNWGWDAYGKNDNGEPCFRMLWWANASDAKGSSGENAICQLLTFGLEVSDFDR